MENKLTMEIRINAIFYEQYMTVAIKVSIKNEIFKVNLAHWINYVYVRRGIWNIFIPF